MMLCLGYFRVIVYLWLLFVGLFSKERCVLSFGISLYFVELEVLFRPVRGSFSVQ